MTGNRFPRHRVDLFSLTVGVLSGALAIAALVDGIGWLDDGGRWVVPILLIVLGAGGLLATLLTTRGETSAGD